MMAVSGACKSYLREQLGMAEQVVDAPAWCDPTSDAASKRNSEMAGRTGVLLLGRPNAFFATLKNLPLSTTD
jgi:hypothetical protein